MVTHTSYCVVCVVTLFTCKVLEDPDSKSEDAAVNVGATGAVANLVVTESLPETDATEDTVAVFLARNA